MTEIRGDGWELAQLNVGRALYPMDAPGMAGFAAELDRLNALAERSPGFVWRLQDESGNATGIVTSPDPYFLVNMSVWASLEALSDYVYRSAHREIMIQRRQWFEKPTKPILVLWWVPMGHRPSTDEALDRLERLRRDGPSAEAFGFRSAVPAPKTAPAKDSSAP